jgi:homogentisate 1,2-dioxygenase
MDVWQRVHDTPFAIRDVHHDQIFYVLDGTARLETDFGVLDLVPMDVIRVPRAVSLRLVDVHALNLVVVATPNALHIHPENDAVLSPADVDGGRPYENPVGLPGEYELMIRHGASTTSYFYDYDPLPVLAAPGAPVVQRFNLANVHPLSVKGIAAPPARLIEDPTTETLFFYLGAREGGRPPVHHNADYDEIAVFAKGPGQLGEIKQPGTVVWVPKGVIHQGPEEYVPEGYVAWLFETRAHLELTPAGQNIATLAETSMFGVHPSVTHLAPVG